MRSAAIYEKACKVSPGGVHSPVRSFRHLNMAPIIAESGSGSKLKDVDGQTYIDYCCSWGSLILGHAHPKVVQGVCEQMHKGSSFGLSTELEMLLAEKIISHVPSVEKLRFVSSGTEATMTALRLAKGATGRTKIVKFTGHYHGHSDALLVQAGSGVSSLNSLATSKGVNRTTIADTLCLPFNDKQALEMLFASSAKEEIAAVILEPVTANMGVVLPDPDFLQLLRKITLQTGALLIFDEVVTGFRLGLNGAQGIYGIVPDLTCFGKIIGGGFPAAAVGGKAVFMDQLAPLGQVYQAGTLSGNPIALRAGFETLSLLEESNFYSALQAKMDRFTHPIEKALQSKQARLEKKGSMCSLFFKEGIFTPFFQYLLTQGIYISPSAQESWFLSSAHTNEEIDFTSEAIVRFVKTLPDV